MIGARRASVRDRRRRPRWLRGVRDARPRRSRRARSRYSAPSRIRWRPGVPARRRSGRRGCARRATATAWPRSFPGPRRPRGVARRARSGRSSRLVCNRYRPTVSRSSSATSGALRARTGWDERLRSTARRAGAARSRRVRRRRPGRLPPRARSRPGHPGLAFPPELEGDARAVHAYEPHEYAARGRGRRRRDGGGDRVAERARGRSEGRLGAPARARAPAAQRPRPLFSKRGLSSFHATSPNERAELLRRLGAPSYPPGREWDEPLARAPSEGRFRVAPDRQRRAADHLRDRLSAGLPRTTPLLRSLVDEHGLEVHAELDRACTGRDRADAHEWVSNAGPLGRARAVGVSRADTLVGMKYVARRFLRRVEACPTR